MEEMTLDDYYEVLAETGDFSWYFYSYELINNREKIDNIIDEYIFPNNTKFDNLREYIAEIR